ncbi:MAG: hypothetical protein GY928_20330 [Colwellia sp.]|nr:hypothetical protein [Colwellia sp.]
MNKRERRYLKIYEKNKAQDLSGFNLAQIAERAQLQDTLYRLAWFRYEKYLQSGRRPIFL